MSLLASPSLLSGAPALSPSASPAWAGGGRLLPLGPDLVFDEESFEVRLRGEPLPLQPQIVELIGFLARNEGRLVTKSELIRGPWRGTRVTESALHRAIMLARRAFGQAGQADAIATIRGRGFRFKAAADVAPPPAAAHPNVRWGERSLVGNRIFGEGGQSEVWELRLASSAHRLGFLSVVRQGLAAHVTCAVRRGTSRTDLAAFVDVVVPGWQPGCRRTLVISEHDEPVFLSEPGAASARPLAGPR